MAKFAVALILLIFEVGLAQLVMDRPEYCKCHPRHGPCQAYFPSYYYNVNSGRCEFFVYGGCRGNKNRFPSREKCEDVCKAEIRGENYENDAENHENNENMADNYENYDIVAENHENRDLRETCSQDPEVGPCLARIPHYYFNQDTYTCELFYYGGCGGNANNFRTIEECKLTCLAEFY